MPTLKQQLIANYLQEFLNLTISSNSDPNFDHNQWEIFWKKNEQLTKHSTEFFESRLSLGKNISLSFHDGTFKKITPNSTGDIFTVSLLTHQYQKIDLTAPSIPSNYQQIEPIYLNITLPNNFRNIFRKITQMNSILTFAYDGENLGLIVFDKNWQPQMMVIDSIDLSNVSTSPIPKKNLTP